MKIEDCQGTFFWNLRTKRKYHRNPLEFIEIHRNLLKSMGIHWNPHHATHHTPHTTPHTASIHKSLCRYKLITVETNRQQGANNGWRSSCSQVRLTGIGRQFVLAMLAKFNDHAVDNTPHTTPHHTPHLTPPHTTHHTPHTTHHTPHTTRHGVWRGVDSNGFQWISMDSHGF